MIRSKRHWRWIAILAAALLLLTVLGLAVASAYLNSAGFRETLLRQVDAAIPGQVRVGDHRLALFSGRARFDDVALRDPDGSPAAHAGRIEIRLFWPALLWREIRISSLALHLDRLDLTYDPQDRLLLLEALKPAGHAPAPESSAVPWRWRMDHADVRIAALHYRRPTRNVSAVARGLTLLGRAGSTPLAGNVDARLDRLTWQGPGEATRSIEGLNLAASYDSHRVRPVDLNLSMAGSSLSVQGNLDTTSDDPRVDLTWSSNLDLAEISAWLPGSRDLTGRMQAGGTVTGPLYDPRAKVHLEMAAGRIGTMPVDRLALDLDLRERMIRLSDGVARSPWGEAGIHGTLDLRPIFARDFRATRSGWDTPAYEFTLEGSHLRPQDWSGIPWPFPRGQWRTRIDAQGRGLFGPAIAGSARLKVDAVDVGRGGPTRPLTGTLSADANWKGGAVQLNEGLLATQGCTAKVGGSLDLRDRRMTLHGRLDFVGLDDLGARLGLALPAGKGTLKLEGNGAFGAPEIKASLLAGGIAWKDLTFGRLLAEAVLEPEGTVTISRLVLENQGSFAEATGRLGLLDNQGRIQADPAVSLDMKFTQVEPADFMGRWPLEGHFNGQVSVGGTLQSPTAALSLDPSPVSWDRMGGLLQGKARWEDRRLILDTLQLAKAQSTVHLQGQASWRHPDGGRRPAGPTLQAHLQTRAMRLEDIRDDWSGGLDLEAEVNGPLSALQGRIRLAGGPMNFAGQRLERLEASAALDLGRLEIERLAAHLAPGQVLAGRGWYDFDGRFDFSLQGEDIALEKIDALQRAFPVVGQLNLRLGGSGTFGQPDITAELEVLGPRFRDQPLDDFRVRAHLVERRLDLVAGLNFDLKGYVRLDSGVFDLQADFHRSDLSPYLALAAGPLWAGRLSGGLRAAGDWHVPGKVRIAADLQDVDLTYRTVELLHADALNLALEDGALRLPQTRIAIMQQGYLALKASGELHRKLDFQADGSVPLAALAPFVDELNATQGSVDLHLEARGPLADLRWQADLDLDRLVMALPGLPQPIRDLNGRVKINPDFLVVDSVAGTVGAGDFRLDGKVWLEAMRPVRGRLNFSARSLPLQWTDTMDLVVHGDLHLVGQPGKAMLAGEVDLVEGIYYKDVRLNLFSWVTPTRRRRTEPRGGPPPWMETIGLDVDVGHRNPLLVDNNLAHLQVVPNFKVLGTLARPILSGRAEVTEGEVIYRRKTFTVKRGVVNFINPYQIEPQLDIRSEARIRKWLVSLSVSGTPDDLKFELSSDPPESDNDILSLILVGRTNAELGRGENGESQSTAQMLAALVATAWGEDVKRTTGVDILELETGAQGEGDSPDRTQVTVGKKLSPRLTLKYAVEASEGDMVQKAISEYRFLEHLLVSGFQDSQGGYGGELLWRIEFD